jgi:chromosome segregation ATPase
MTRAESLWSMALAGALAGAALGVSAKGETTQANQDTLSALLTEVRGLPAAIEQMASSGPRVQLSVGRLQLQEQRVNTLLRRVDSLREAIAIAQKEAAQIQGHLADFQGALDRGTRPDDRADLESQIGSDKRRLASLMSEVHRLQAEESDVMSQVSAEQARWTDINQRLEDLEAALSRR